MNAHINKNIPIEPFLIVGLIALILFLPAMPYQQSDKTAMEQTFIPFAVSGTIEFANTENSYPLLETLYPNDLAIGIEETTIGYTITNNNDKFVLLSFDTPETSYSIILGTLEQIRVPNNVAISMSFPDSRGITGTSGNWEFISIENYIRVTS